LHRTFGGLIRGDGLVTDGDTRLRTAAPRKQLAVAVHVLTAQTETPGDWIAQLVKQAEEHDAVATATACAEHVAWWQSFWARSWIHVSGTPEADIVSRGYELQRFMNACAGRGAYPIKFNGSIFTVDGRETLGRDLSPDGLPVDADYRRWGGGYWFQNTRLIYWSMIMSGDFDLMEPWFRMYVDALPLALARAKTCFGIDAAAMFPETMTFWGAFLNVNYGYRRGDLPPGISENTFIRRYWQGTIELVAVLLDAYAVSQDETLLQDRLLVLAPPLLRFFRDHFSQRDADGKIVFSPCQSLETWHDADNPTPEIAGLQSVLDGLLALPADKLPCELRHEWAAYRAELPDLPVGEVDGQARILPAATARGEVANTENPELYAVFPYRLFGVGQPGLETALATWASRRIKRTGGWSQDAIQAALLGLAEEAKADVIKNFSEHHEESRFPAFWGPNFDWIPDQDHGNVACIALQRMLLQWDPPAPGADGAAGRPLRMLPAWPQDWNVAFRLHAPGRIVVEGQFEHGRLREIRTVPDHRPACTTP
jgi:hypothetical protein